ncbi:MAG: thiosulfate-binding protein SoxY [Chlorobium sp.]|nr:MAG: thiosulfate-binding protein SoxY [Chlorobium sp.]
MKRRQFIAKGAGCSAFLLSMSPASLFGAWSAKDFHQCSIDQAFMAALGTSAPDRSDKITIVASPVAEDSSVVPVQVISSLKSEVLYLFVEKNVTPLVIKCTLQGNVLPWFSLNIKMKESSTLYAVVKSEGRFFMTSVNVEIVAQAC